ncbi:hypothetical protein METBIDRAFT_51156 [Metschnikowia bicuspidata var. bicuspidata NRRL YB-4993]|uniref:ferric-chelate reductase (NADPH) n=1 Tax=Metschnikowia bicuspidata var. bicuspidata NRRL YB-4993 TaxID=869754 RepID=A0A1A0HHZ1_9ASCO|nr:hypothetical protein METBIDRAFT_51156 [Metschnikowia bicuspidata var. bicuspidata NRRL YB-4993]OBA23779.1 hypothetical protein METBIDRAFT_51156 [Metschnikowia bicuspidata var. bicuspidata NRRL YB-4993]
MVSVSKIACLAFAAAALADQAIFIYHKADLSVDACEKLLGKTALFFDSDDDEDYCNTNIQQALGSMAHCLKRLPTDIGVNAFIESCSDSNLTLEEFNESYDNATQYLVNVTSYLGFDIDETFYLPVELDEDKLYGAYASTVDRRYNYNRSNYYGWALMLYWFALVLFSGFLRIVSAMTPKTVQSFNGKISNTYKSYITMPALGKEKKVQHGKLFKFFEFIIPTRMETIHLVIYFALVLAFNTANFHHQSNNVIWSDEATEMGRKIADRSGIMVLYIIPQLVLFAGRNNFFEWISGWKYARFNIIHHWMGRIAFILMFVHAISMTVSSFGLGKFDSRNAKPYVRWGYVALICAAIMCFHSLQMFRKKHYEMFVLAHNILGVFFVAGVWIHVSDAGFESTMYAASAVWCFDKFLRIVRMAWFGVRTADVQLIADETLRVKVPRPSYWKPYPLCYSFVYFFRPSCFWQSHPFTVVDSVVEENVISFYIKVKGGMSNSLYQYLSKQVDQRAMIKVCVEGPYGPGASLQHYDTVSYLTGTTGVPGPFASAVSLAKKNSTQKLKLYWVIRHWKSIEWFYEELRSLKGTKVQPIVYVTQFNTPLDECFLERFKSEDESLVDGKNSEKGSEAEKEINMENAERIMANLPHIEFRAGRPDINALVKHDIAESAGATAFVACGHDSFVDQSRKAVVENL